MLEARTSMMRGFIIDVEGEDIDDEGVHHQC
jgi:hypothetical protein